MINHEYFRELCALAEIGEISEEEKASLAAHLRLCPDCRLAAEDYRSILFDWLPLHASLDSSAALDPRQAPPETRRRTRWFIPVAAMLMLTLGASTFWAFEKSGDAKRLQQALQTANREHSVLLQSVEDQKKQISGLERSLTESRTASRTSKLPVPPATDRAQADLESKLISLEQEKADLTAKLRTVVSERDGYVRKLVETQSADMERKTELARLLDRSRSLQMELDRRDRRIQDLSQRVTTLEAKSQPPTPKNQSSPDTLDDLLSDPSLKITDIYAVSNKSKKPNSFGRIVTADGRPALIYAFKLTVGDFPEPAGPRHIQVWGLKRAGEFDPVGLLNPRVGSDDSAVRLGKLTQDDPVADRWVLSVGDSRALAGIRYLLIVENASNTLPAVQPLLYGYVNE